MRYNRADATRKDHDRKTRDNSEDSELLGLGLGIDVTIYVSSDIYGYRHRKIVPMCGPIY